MTRRGRSAAQIKPSGIVTLLTDFGTADGYVGAMKGSVLAIAPNARLVDVSHEVGPGDVRGGALALEAAAATFPPGTVHVAVVDPGVGTSRRAVAVATEHAVFVGPDNGLLALAARDARAVVVLDRVRWHRRPVSATFHGRDVFAPAAARLTAGVPLRELGSPGGSLRALDLPVVERSHRGFKGHVVHIDRFGNLITNLTVDHLAALERRGDAPAGMTIRRRRPLPILRTYGDARAGSLLALVGSSGRVEIAVRDGSAAAALGVRRPGTRVELVRCAGARRG